MSYYPIELDEDYYHKHWEDYKNNQYWFILNDDVEKWIKENLSGDYELDCEDHWYDRGTAIYIVFENDEDSMAFKLRWL